MDCRPHGDAAGAASQVVNSKNPDGDVFDINTLSPDELGKLLDTDDYDLELDIPDDLFDPDGHINMDFDAGYGNQMHHANSAPVHSPKQAHMEAARSVLASMDSAHQGEQSIHMHHAHSAPTHMFHNPQQFVQQPIYIKDQSGNFVQVNATIPMGSIPMGNMGPPMQSQAILPGVPFQPAHSAGEVKYHVHQSSMMPNIDPFQHFMTMGAQMYESGSVQNSPTKEAGKKKPRRKQGPTETVQQQRVRADKGYTKHPYNSQYMRHGPALKAYAKDNKEIPAIKDIFATFAKNEGFSRPPPTVVNLEARVGGPLCSSLVKHQLEAEKRVQDDAEAARLEAERSKLVGVSRDEWSLFWKAHVERPASKNESDTLVKEEEGNDAEDQVPEAKREQVFCGEYPSMEQAARGHDIVALKLHGETTQLNFPLDQYKAVLQVVNSHTEQELINAVLKDAELAMQRTSKFKGVRKTGPNHYEAVIDTEMVARAIQQNVKNEKKANLAANKAGEAPSIQHRTNTFHA